MNKIITVGREFGCRLAETLGKVAFSMWWFFPHVHQHHRFDAYHHVQPGRLRGDEQLDVATVVLPPVVKHPLLLSEKYRYPVVSTAAPGVGFLVSPTLTRVAAASSSPPHFTKNAQ